MITNTHSVVLTWKTLLLFSSLEVLTTWHRLYAASSIGVIGT